MDQTDIDILRHAKDSGTSCKPCKSRRGIERPAEGALKNKEGIWDFMCRDCYREFDDHPMYGEGSLPW